MTCSRSQQALSEVTAASKALMCKAFAVKFLYSAPPSSVLSLSFVCIRTSTWEESRVYRHCTSIKYCMTVSDISQHLCSFIDKIAHLSSKCNKLNVFIFTHSFFRVCFSCKNLVYNLWAKDARITPSTSTMSVTRRRNAISMLVSVGICRRTYSCCYRSAAGTFFLCASSSPSFASVCYSLI